MLQPARRKYRKEQKGRNRGIATRGNKVSFGDYGLKATTRGRLTARQIEAGRRQIAARVRQHQGRSGQLSATALERCEHAQAGEDENRVVLDEVASIPAQRGEGEVAQDAVCYHVDGGPLFR